MTISILLVDNHTIFREGIRAWLETVPDLCIVGEGSDGRAALALAESLRPDVVVMECLLPGLSGLETIPLLRILQPGIKVVMFSLHDETAYVQYAIQKGASAYILKEDVVDHLEKAVTAAAAGEYYFSPSLRKWAAQSGLIKPDGNAETKF